MTRGGLNKNSMSQFFRDNGEIFYKEKESYSTWYKRCVLKYFPNKRKEHNKITYKNYINRYHINSEFKRFCKIECF